MSATKLHPRSQTLRTQPVQLICHTMAAEILAKFQALEVEAVSAIVHPYSNVLARLRCTNCTPVDLLPSLLAAQCASCSAAAALRYYPFIFCDPVQGLGFRPEGSCLAGIPQQIRQSGRRKALPVLFLIMLCRACTCKGYGLGGPESLHKMVIRLGKQRLI